ncbi:hypothetical protein SCLCIDRAFT_1216232 [Scleroderma citrinum Foug A]|uniref:Uncharacterized protein n=1 Tax=Scleroderma citrinum Foug A TaxID=1036808 RepID=A0A0C3DY77_9AGAM|nr:hypothetical protein SCLCIDRAFT_1216232 [Scleroderma citrinum Foug A]
MTASQTHAATHPRRKFEVLKILQWLYVAKDAQESLCRLIRVSLADSCLHTKYTQDPREKGIPYCGLMLMHS